VLPPERNSSRESGPEVLIFMEVQRTQRWNYPFEGAEVGFRRALASKAQVSPFGLLRPPHVGDRRQTVQAV
jgi:hypothetical protein